MYAAIRRNAFSAYDEYHSTELAEYVILYCKGKYSYAQPPNVEQFPSADSHSLLNIFAMSSVLKPRHAMVEMVPE
jgi:hypothetical protein